MANAYTPDLVPWPRSPESPEPPEGSTEHYLKLLSTRVWEWPARNARSLQRIHDIARCRLRPWALIEVWRRDRTPEQNREAYVRLESSMRSLADVTMLLGNVREHGVAVVEPWLVCLGMCHERMLEIGGDDGNMLRLAIDPVHNRVHTSTGGPSRHLGQFHAGLIARHIAESSARDFVGFDDPARPWLEMLPAVASPGNDDVGDVQPIRAAVRGWFRELDLRFQTTDGLTGMPTGIPALDRVGGVAPGELVVLAGPPGSGKTALAVSVAMVASTSGVPGVYVNLADTSSNIVERLMTASVGVDACALRKGELTRSNMSGLTYAAAEATKLPLVTHECPSGGTTVAALRQVVRAWRTGTDARCPFVVVDYLQLLHGELRVRGLLELARSLGVAVFAVAQLDDTGAEPMHEVSTAMLVLTPPGGDEKRHRLSLVKHRHGPLVDEWLGFDEAKGVFARLGAS